MAILATGVTKVSGKVADTSGEVVLTAADVGITNVGLGGGAINIGVLGINDLNDIRASGHYYTSNPENLNRPSSAAGPIVHVQGAAGFQQYVRDNTLMFRGFTGTTFHPWQTIYHQGFKPTAADIQNVVSPVSSGGIIERGSNANGEYVKFADGTMICTAGSLNVSRAFNGPVGTALFQCLEVEQPLPVTFIANPTCMWSCEYLSGNVRPIVIHVSSSTTVARCVAQLGAALTITASYYVQAIGRWK